MNISMSSPALTGAEIVAVNQVLTTRYLNIGPQRVLRRKIDWHGSVCGLLSGGRDGIIARQNTSEWQVDRDRNPSVLKDKTVGRI